MRHQAKQVRIRATLEDAARWKQSAASASLNLSDWFRVQLGAIPVGRDPVIRRPYRRADPALLAQLGRISGSLHQVARWCNIHKSAVEAVNVLTALRSIEEQVLDLRRSEGAKDDRQDI